MNLNKYHLVAVAVGVVIGVVAGPKLRTLPVLNKLKLP
jgi:hypothetical protein